jgi:hypothetical protein
MERLVRERCVGSGRVKKQPDDLDAESIPKFPDVSYEMPTFGIDVWTGEEEASEATYDLIERADQGGRLRALIDAIRSNRVEEDFSARWSWAREDFERKLHRKRSRWRVHFVELKESTAQCTKSRAGCRQGVGTRAASWRDRPIAARRAHQRRARFRAHPSTLTVLRSVPKR